MQILFILLLTVMTTPISANNGSAVSIYEYEDQNELAWTPGTLSSDDYDEYRSVNIIGGYSKGSEGGTRHSNTLRFSSLDLDGNDRPRIAYCRIPYFGTLPGDIRYAYKDGSSWSIGTVATVDDVRDSSLALDSSDNPHILFVDCTNEDDKLLKYAYYDGGTWETTTIASAGGEAGGEYNWPDLVFDVYDNLHITYYNTGLDDLVYGYYDGSNWEFTTVDTNLGQYGGDCTIDLDSYRRPHISYENDMGDFEAELKYAYFDGYNWHTEVVDPNLLGIHGTSIAIDSYGCPHIAYCATHDVDLKYAVKEGGNWRIEYVERIGSVGDYPSLALDSLDNPHIGYDGDAGLNYAQYDGVDWQISTISEDGGGYNSLVLDSEEYPHIASCSGFLAYFYYDGLNWHEEIVDDGVYSEIILDFFKATPDKRGGIALSWGISVSEDESIAGFNLYRRPVSFTHTATANSSWIRVNDYVITGENPYTYKDAGVEPGVIYEYKLEAIVGGSPETLGTTTGTAGTQPVAFALYQSRPNPARGESVIAFELPEATDVTLAVYDLSGRKVATLADGLLPAGEHERAVSGLAPGVYIYRLDAGGFVAVKKMVVIE
jgi:hypothetical protein